MKNLRIPIIGQPNVGKSCLLNALAGSKVIVSNYPGTTVDLTRATKTFDGTTITFEDTPGIYSISDRSEEEKVTERALFDQVVDKVVVIADSTALDRGLYLALQASEAEVPVVIALNFNEDAERKGKSVDAGRLTQILHAPVVRINPLTKAGITELLEELSKDNVRPNEQFRVEYDNRVEEAIVEVSGRIAPTRLPTRFIALRVLEGDADFFEYVRPEEDGGEGGHQALGPPELSEDIALTRYKTAQFIAGLVTTTITHPQEKRALQDNVDRLFLGNVSGPVASGLLLLVIFGVLLYLGNLIQGILMDLVDSLVAGFGSGETSILNMVLAQGLTGVAAGVSIAVPYVFIFYVLLTLLEDAGVLARLVVNTERVLGKLGLSGKAFIPLALGLGCTAPASRATRILSSKSEQFYAVSLLAFVPCSSRIAIVMGVVGFFGGLWLALVLFASLVIAALLWALVFERVMPAQTEALLLELPPYRRPLAKNVFLKSWLRMREFIFVVIPFLIFGGLAYGALDAFDLTRFVVEPFSPVTGWLGLPAVTIIPLMFGFLQKDLTPAMLVSVMGTDIAGALTTAQIYTFGLAAIVGIPCVIAFGMIIREFGVVRATSLTVVSILYGLVLAGVVWRVVEFF